MALITKNCPVCFIEYGIPQAMHDAKWTEGGHWYCPNGHQLVFTETKLDKITAERNRLAKETEAAKTAAERERQWRVEAYEEARAAQRRLAAQKGVTTRMKNRVANGVCPCCNRTFNNLQRHMATKHAGFVTEEVQTEIGQTIQ